MRGTILETIVKTKRAEIDAAKAARPIAELKAAVDAADAPRDFYGAVLAAGQHTRLIAEIKKASPSAGLIRPDFDPIAVARAYEDAGATALSVLTDKTYFQGDLAFIAGIKEVVGLPVLRKDFMIDAYQLYESRAAGADAILLIAAILSPPVIDTFNALAAAMGMASLIEVHDETELRRVHHLIGPQHRAILGINNRDLRAQTTDIGTAERLAEVLWDLNVDTCFVAESGIKTPADVSRMHAAGAAALLIGETLLRASDPGAKVRELFVHNRG